MSELIQIPGQLQNAAVDSQGNREPVASAADIYDSTYSKRQSEINAEVPRASYKVVAMSADVTANESPASGYEVDVIYTNSTSGALTVTASKNTYATPDGDDLAISVPAGGYGEISFLNISNTIYARGV